MNDINQMDILGAIQDQKQTIIKEISTVDPVQVGIQAGRELQALDLVEEIIKHYRWRYKEVSDETT